MIEDALIMLIMLTVIFIPLGLGGIVLYIIDKIEEIKERKEIEKLIKDNRSKTFEQYVKGWDL